MNPMKNLSTFYLDENAVYCFIKNREHLINQTLLYSVTVPNGDISDDYSSGARDIKKLTSL